MARASPREVDRDGRDEGALKGLAYFAELSRQGRPHALLDLVLLGGKCGLHVVQRDRGLGLHELRLP